MAGSILNLGIVAHVDAGKTTLTEQILFACGAIRRIGRVDEGTTQTDFLRIERQRGISVRAAMMPLTLHDARVNLIDTPGHADFLSEVERALRVMDVAILVISAVEGVQSQTKVLWDGLRALHIPAILFLNKVDRVGADVESVLEEVREQLSPDVVRLEGWAEPEQLREGDAGARSIGPLESDRERLMEFLAERDEAVLEAYLSGDAEGMTGDDTESGAADGEHAMAGAEATPGRAAADDSPSSADPNKPERDLASIDASASPRDAFLLRAMRRHFLAGDFVPALTGSALRGEGISALLEALYALAPRAGGDADAALSGVVFRVLHDPQHGRVAHVRLYAGSLHNRDSVHNATRNESGKVFQIRAITGEKGVDTGELRAGEIGAVYGLGDIRVGDVLGVAAHVPGGVQLAEPMLRVRVYAADATPPKLAEALMELSVEDPLLRCIRDGDAVHISITGTIQLEFIQSILAERFGITVTFGSPMVIYKETPAAIAYGFEAYTMPKPCWAVIRFLIEPMPRGSGVSYVNEISNEKIHYRYQGQIAQTLPDALQQGPKGWEVTDIRIRLIDGEDHPIHTHPLDFALATPLALMDGLVRAGTTLLEPMVRMRIRVPGESLGRLMSEIVRMRGTFDPPNLRGTEAIVEVRAPVATTLDFPTRLAAMTGGQGNLMTRYDGYEPCAYDEGLSQKHRGVDPRERSKYILWKRSALQDSNRG